MESQSQATQPSTASTFDKVVRPANGASVDGEGRDNPEPAQQPRANDNAAIRGESVSTLKKAGGKAGKIVCDMLEYCIETGFVVMQIMWAFFWPIIVGTVGRVLVTALFAWIAVAAILDSSPVKNAVCTMPLISYVPGVESFFHCTSMTTALAVYGEAHQDLGDLDAISIQLLTPASTFIFAEQTLTDAGTFVGVSEHSQAEVMSVALNKYASDIAALGRGLSEFFNQLTTLMELMAINLEDISKALAKHKHRNIVARTINPRSEIIDVLNSHLKFAMEGAKRITTKGNAQVLQLKATMESGTTVKARQVQSLKEVRRILRETWTHPFKITAWFEEQLELEAVLQAVSVQSLEPLSRTWLAIDHQMATIIEELEAVRNDIISNQGRFYSSETQIRSLAEHARSLLDKASFMKQTQRLQHAKMLAEINKTSRKAGL